MPETSAVFEPSAESRRGPVVHQLPPQDQHRVGGGPFIARGLAQNLPQSPGNRHPEPDDAGEECQGERARAPGPNSCRNVAWLLAGMRRETISADGG